MFMINIAEIRFFLEKKAHLGIKFGEKSLFGDRNVFLSNFRAKYKFENFRIFKLSTCLNLDKQALLYIVEC